MTTWYTVTATECWLGSKLLEHKMIVMIEREMNFIPVIRSIVRICVLNISTNALLFVSISTWRTVPFESHNHTWPRGIQSQPQSVDLAQKYSNSKWSSCSKETSSSYQWYFQLYEYVPWTTPQMHCSLFHSQHDEPNRSSHTITHVVYSHSHRVLTSLNNSRTQNDRHVLTRDEFHTSNTEKNKAKMKFTNTTTNTTLLTTKTLTY